MSVTVNNFSLQSSQGTPDSVSQKENSSLAEKDLSADIQQAFLHQLSGYAADYEKLKASGTSVIDDTPAQQALKKALPLLGAPLQSDTSSKTVSSWEIYRQVCEALGNMQTNYMDVYTRVTEKYQQFMEEFNTFKSSLTNYMDNGKDTINIQVRAVMDKVNTLINKWNSTPLLSIKDPAEAAYWTEQLGINPVKSGGIYNFYVNTQPVADIGKSLRDMDPNIVPSQNISISAARFNLWQNTINSSTNTIESDTQVMAQKYSQANTIFNNLAKILSSTMDALYQTDKEFLRV